MGALKGRCPKCNSEYEYEVADIGQNAECPCGAKFLLTGEGKQESGDRSKEPASATTAGFKGKVFSDSINLYEDQAKLVFKYVKEAAGKIIGEEDCINKEIRAREAEKTSLMGKIATLKKLFLISLIIAVLCAAAAIYFIYLLILTVAGMVAAIIVKMKEKTCRETVAKAEVVIGNLKSDFAKIRRDYQIRKLGVAYVPIASRIPFESKSFLIDHTESAEHKEFSLFLMKEQNTFIETIHSIDAGLKTVPVMEESDLLESVPTGHMSRSMQQVTSYDYLGSLDRNLRSASFYLNDLNKISVSIPVILPGSDQARFIADFCTSDVGNAKVVQVFDLKKYENQLDQFKALNELRKSLERDTSQFEKFLQDFIDKIASQVQLIAKVKISSTNKIVEYSNRILTLAFKASYNHYSVAMEDEEIKKLQEERFDFQESVDSYRPFSLKASSRVHFDPLSENWVAEDGSRTSFPFGIHQIHEEIVAPMVQNLLRETRVERLKIYNDIKAQKLDYLNQWHRDTDDFYGRGRAESSNIINLMQSALTEFNTALSQYKAFEDTEKNMTTSGGLDTSANVTKGSASAMAISMLYCKEQTEQIRKEQDEFNNYVERLKEDIDRRAGDFGYIHYFDGSLRDGNSKDLVISLLNTDRLDSRRKSLVGVSAYFAGKADLPPAPVLESIAYEQLGLNLEALARSTIDELRQEEVKIQQGEHPEATEISEAEQETERTAVEDADTDILPPLPIQ